MKCPFRTKVVREFERVEDVCLTKEESIEYPECYGSDCPFYNYSGRCTRADEEVYE